MTHAKHTIIKIIIIGILLLILLLFGLFIHFLYPFTKLKINNNYNQQPISNVPSPSVFTFDSSKADNFVPLKNYPYVYALAPINNPANVKLMNNYLDKKSAQSLLLPAKCVRAVNGGFYDQSGKSLGLVVVNSKEIYPPIASKLFDGFFSLQKENIPEISYEIPSNVTVALQSGPIVYFENHPVPLSIRNDTNERRMLLLTHKNATLSFLALYDSHQLFSGPLLAEVPDIITQISKNLPSPILSAINLDGGSASFFTNGTTTLSELTHVGSLLCEVSHE